MDTRMAECSEQAAVWNGVAGSAWVDMQGLLDGMFEPLETALLYALPADARRVLDVGCGTGATTLAIARRLGADGACTGVDVSAPMIALAQARAERGGLRVEFVHADAQRYRFAPGAFDAIASRLGVMFFDDPVAAFRNLHGAARKGAALRCIAWRGPADNPFMTAAERGAAGLLLELSTRANAGTGQFAFGDSTYVRGVLADAGWQDTAVRPLDLECTFAASDLIPYLTRLGPVGRILPTVDDATRVRVIDAALEAFAPYVVGDRVRFNAACWMIEGQA